MKDPFRLLHYEGTGRKQIYTLKVLTPGCHSSPSPVPDREWTGTDVRVDWTLIQRSDSKREPGTECRTMRTGSCHELNKPRRDRGTNFSQGIISNDYSRLGVKNVGTKYQGTDHRTVVGRTPVVIEY